MITIIIAILAKQHGLQSFILASKQANLSAQSNIKLLKIIRLSSNLALLVALRIARSLCALVILSPFLPIRHVLVLNRHRSSLFQRQRPIRHVRFIPAHLQQRAVQAGQTRHFTNELVG